ncbi:MAG: signal recognition particle protein [Phycisphaerales bacterium]
MFERLSDGFSKALRNLSGQGTISESNVRDAMAEVRTALLEADVDYQTVNEFCERVMEDALGTEVTKSLKPAQEMIGIVHKRLVELISQGDHPQRPIPQADPGPTVIMMCGLQGSGKTTTCGKIAAYLRRKKRSVMLAAADLQRPAAVDQLRTIADQLGEQDPDGPLVLFYSEPDKVAAYGKAVGVAVDVCRSAYAAAKKAGVDTLILDTAGRLHINDDLMRELEGVKKAVPPHQVMLVVDAMTGQDAVNSARSFHERLGIDGIVLSKFDSDTRGGAALTVRKITGAPIRFIGTGEKLDSIEEFHAERIAGRILGMGDVVSLVEKAQSEVSEAEAEKLADKMARGELTFDDFLKQMKSIRKMGPMKQLLGMLPGIGSAIKDLNIEDKQLDQLEGIINSMTEGERTNKERLTPSRKKRVARGSGRQQGQIDQLVKQFEAASKLTKQLSTMGMRDRMTAMKAMQGAGGAGGAGDMGMMPGGIPGLTSRRSTHTVSPKARAKQRKKRKK